MAFPVLAAVIGAGLGAVYTKASGGSNRDMIKNALIGEEDASPAFPTLEDIVTVQVRPSASTDVQVEVFAGLV